MSRRPVQLSDISTNVPTIDDNFSLVYFEYIPRGLSGVWSGGEGAVNGGVSINMQTMCRLFTSWRQQQKQHVQQQPKRQTESREIDR